MRTVRSSSRLLEGGLPRGVWIPACTGADTPPVNRMTDRQVCKHYLSATSFADGYYVRVEDLILWQEG